MKTANGLRIALAALLAAAAADRAAAVSFDRPRWFPSAGLSMPPLHGGRADPLASPLVAYSLPVAAPDGSPTVADRYDPADLWTAATIAGRWTDPASNTLWTARFKTKLPAFRNWISYEEWESWRSRPDSAFDPESIAAVAEAALSTSPVRLDGGPIETRPANPAIERLLRFTSSESPNALVYAILPKRSDWTDSREWRLVAFVPSPSEAAAAENGEIRARFESECLARISLPGKAYRPPPDVPQAETLPPDGRARRKAVHEAFADYPQWNVSDTAEVTVADCLPAAAGRAFVEALTNDLPRLRRAYADVLQGRLPAPPRGARALAEAGPPLPVTNSLALVRVFAERADYLSYLGAAAGAGHEGSAAVWMPSRRELVLNLQDALAKDGLMSVVRHEAFHQFLFYAAAGAESPPWFNEGLAELFAGASITPGGTVEFEFNESYAAVAKSLADSMPDLFPALVAADYPAFYSGSPRDCAVRYALAWSICWFLVAEDGAPALNGRPFANTLPRCFASLRDTRSPAAATLAAFGDADGVSDFIYAWRRYWRSK